MFLKIQLFSIKIILSELFSYERIYSKEKSVLNRNKQMINKNRRRMEKWSEEKMC